MNYGCKTELNVRIQLHAFFVFFIVCPFDYSNFVVSRKVGIPLTGLTTPVRWLLLPQMTFLSRSAIIVKSKFL